MKVSYNWLSQYVDLSGVSPYELADLLTNSGVAVDIVEKRNQGIEQVVIGHVLESVKHPNAEKLNVCTVDIGDNEPLQIVCGAANVAKGQRVPVALVGAKLPGDVKIKRAKLRGTESQGMICSAKELGMNEKLLPKSKSEGILVLPEDATIGEKIEPLLGFDDYILELDLTPNRSDCLSMIGVAYEVAAILDKEVTLPEDAVGVKLSTNPEVKIEIQAKEACTHYAARLLKDVKITESPQWLQNRLISAGIRPINNVVDVTNYVLMEYGQPLHAFDFDRLEQPKIVVRMAKQAEKMVTLDDQERELDEQMLLITDGIKPIAIAGVMGAANSEVTNKTTSILLESAYFKGSTVRRTSKHLGLRSEASLRFEKGVDPNRIYSALNRAAELLQELAGAKLIGDIYEDINERPKEEKVSIEPDRINKLLGTSIEKKDMISILFRLRFDVKDEGNQLEVTIPTRRQDISIEADLVEEIARLYGYDNIPTTLPEGSYIQGGLTDKQKLRRKIKGLLDGAGLQEVITYTFADADEQGRVQGLVNHFQPIKLVMPLSEERQTLRTNLVTNLLDVARYNINHRNKDVRIYEMGAIFLTEESKLTKLPNEKWVVAGLLTGSVPKHWQQQEATLDFYYLKGILEDLFKELGLKDILYKAATPKGYHPGRTAEVYVNNSFLGYIGQIHPDLQEHYDLKETYAFEIDLHKLLADADVEIDYTALPKYPAIQRDIALVVPIELEANELMNTIYQNGGDLLESLTLFDVYVNEQIGKDKKSLAFSLTYRSKDRTLTDDEASKQHEKIVNALREQFDVDLRK